MYDWTPPLIAGIVGIAATFFIVAVRLRQKIADHEEQRLVFRFESAEKYGTQTRFMFSMGAAGAMSVPTSQVVLRRIEPGYNRPTVLKPTLHQRGDFSPVTVNPGAPVYFYQVVTWDSATKSFSFDPQGDVGIHAFGAGTYVITLDVRGLNTIGRQYSYEVSVSDADEAHIMPIVPTPQPKQAQKQSVTPSSSGTSGSPK